MSDAVAVAIVNFFAALVWPAVALFSIVYVVKALRDGLLARVLPEGGAISWGDARLEVRKNIETAEISAEDVVEASGSHQSPEPTFVMPSDFEPYDLVMDSWYDLSDAITEFAVEHGGADDRRRVWENLERLVDAGELKEADKGAVRDLQKARNSIKRLQEVDRDSAMRFAEAALKLTTFFKDKLENIGGE